MSELICIGTSDAFGAGGRLQSAYLLRTPGGAALLDCGQTTLSGLSMQGIDRGEVDAVIISHFHADHFGGLPLLLQAARYVDGRRTPLTIAGPPGIEARLQEAGRSLGHELEPDKLGFELRFAEFAAGRRIEAGPVQVSGFETFHTPASRPHGMVVSAGGVRVAYSGDTGWFDELPARVSGASLFLCECTLLQKSFMYHLSLEELNERQREFDCGRLLLTHLGIEMRTAKQIEGFERADDGLRIAL